MRSQPWILDPPLTSCAWCPQWQIACATVEEKTETERRHQAKYHAGAVAVDVHDITDRMLGEHPDDRDVIISAILADAREHGGHVDPNRVRDSLPADVVPQVVGPVYSALRKAGRLIPDGENINTDKHGRNVGKKQTTYLLAPVVTP